MEELKRIAEGEPMDVVMAVRVLAGAVVDLDRRLAANAASAKMENVDSGAILGPEQDGLDGLLNDRVAMALHRAGYATVAAVARAPDEELRQVNGVGPATLREIRQAIPGT